MKKAMHQQGLFHVKKLKINMINIHDDQLPSFTTGSAVGSGTYDIHKKKMNA